MYLNNLNSFLMSELTCSRRVRREICYSPPSCPLLSPILIFTEIVLSSLSTGSVSIVMIVLTSSLLSLHPVSKFVEISLYSPASCRAYVGLDTGHSDNNASFNKEG